MASLPASHSTPIIVVGYIVVMVLAAVLARDSQAVTVGLTTLGVALVLGGLQWDLKRRLDRARADDPHRDEHYFIDVSVGGVRTYCDHIDTRYTWEGLSSVIETPEFFLFVRGSSGGPALPKRVLSPEDLMGLRNLIVSHSPDRGVRLVSTNPG
jgi:hypothetical protein